MQSGSVLFVGVRGRFYRGRSFREGAMDLSIIQDTLQSHLYIAGQTSSQMDMHMFKKTVSGYS